MGNHETGETSWEKPPTAGASAAVPATGAQSGTSASQSPWQEHMDEKTKHAYWFNHETGETSWEKPPTAGASAKAAPIVIAKWQEPLNQPKPKPLLVTDDNGFAHHVSCDIEGHDFACSGSDNGESCHYLVSGVADAILKCKAESQCDGFVITKTKLNGSHSMWMKSAQSFYDSPASGSKTLGNYLKQGNMQG